MTKQETKTKSASGSPIRLPGWPHPIPLEQITVDKVNEVHLRAWKPLWYKYKPTEDEIRDRQLSCMMADSLTSRPESELPKPQKIALSYCCFHGVAGVEKNRLKAYRINKVEGTEKFYKQYCEVVLDNLNGEEGGDVIQPKFLRKTRIIWCQS
jgi:hypothetical protein